MPLSIKERASAVKAIIFDVDGVFTRGEIIYGPDGEWKVFNVQDGQGCQLAREAGLKVFLLTGRASAAVRHRAKDLKADLLLEGVEDKDKAFRNLLKKWQIKANEVCYVGDDVVDLAPMAQCGMPVAVANAVAEVKAQAVWVTRKNGGCGAVREVIEMILKAKGMWRGMIQRYRGLR